MKLRIATCLTLPEPDGDAEPLAAALAAAGFEAALVAWDDPPADWDAPIPTILRSTWNYAHDLTASSRGSTAPRPRAPLWNPPDVVVDNVHKRYLLELARRGVPVVPTTMVERGATIRTAARARRDQARGRGRLARHARVRGRRSSTRRRALAALTARGAALVQPYLASVDDYGERSLVWIDGELSHAIRKTPRFSGDAERVTARYPIAPDERAVASPRSRRSQIGSSTAASISRAMPPAGRW